MYLFIKNAKTLKIFDRFVINIFLFNRKKTMYVIISLQENYNKAIIYKGKEKNIKECRKLNSKKIRSHQFTGVCHVFFCDAK